MNPLSLMCMQTLVPDIAMSHKLSVSAPTALPEKSRGICIVLCKVVFFSTPCLLPADGFSQTLPLLPLQAPKVRSHNSHIAFSR